MSDDIAISVRDVSKRFRLFRSPAERLLAAFALGGKGCSDFWALRDVSFDIPRGSTVGILGRNGSGKSTLLQIIFSVLQPTTGTIERHGRVSALLELGAGFNPAFTGRANVLLHGAMMGLTQIEIKERMPAIEAFAEIGPFIDQPVKNYSSGMFVRLAFAAAIVDDPDILIVDEALAVGDAKFQQKCYHKFLEFQRSGKTVILVTHDTQAVLKHCHHALLLENGRLVGDGEPKDVVNHYYELLFTGGIAEHRPLPVRVRQGYKGFSLVHYGSKHYALAEAVGPFDLSKASESELLQLQSEGMCTWAGSLKDVERLVDALAKRSGAAATATAACRSALDEFFEEAPSEDQCPLRRSYNKNEHRFGDRRAEIVDYLIVCTDNRDIVTVLSGDIIEIYVKVRFHEAVDLPMVGFALKTVDGVVIYGTNTRMKKVSAGAAGADEVVVYKLAFRMPLRPGDFFLDLGLAEKLPAEDNPIDIRYDLIHLHVHEREFFSGLVNLEAKLEEVSRVAGPSWSRERAFGS